MDKCLRCDQLAAENERLKEDIAERDRLADKRPLLDPRHVHTFGSVQCYACVQREARVAALEAYIQQQVTYAHAKWCVGGFCCAECVNGRAALTPDAAHKESP